MNSSFDMPDGQSGAHADALAGGERAASPSSNTGINTRQDPSAAPETPQQWDLEFAPDSIELYSIGGRGVALLQAIPNERAAPNVALIDWLAFTIRLRGAQTAGDVIADVRRLGVLTSVEHSASGFNGYACKAVWREAGTQLGLVAWGGKTQKGTVHVSITGQGCAKVEDWGAVHAWLASHAAAITRLDLAHDDFDAERIDIERAVRWYRDGGFNANGRPPQYAQFGDWRCPGEVKRGRTFKIGSRAGGKECRVYEKGKQLGDEASRWVRVEVEWRNKAREIPLDALTRPGAYLAGAYACLGFLSASQSRIATTRQEARISFERAMANGRHAAGKLLNLALELFGGDYGAVVEALRRPGYPARVLPYVGATARDPKAMDPESADEPKADR